MSFKPAWWLPEGHSQTLWRKLTFNKTIPLSRERLELDDGDFIDLDWAIAANQSCKEVDSVVVILHGLCGCSGSPYVIALQSLLARKGVASVAMNFRGCSGELNRLARAYHSGVSDDLQFVFESIRTKFINARFHFVGYSLGANVLLKWLGETSGDEQVAGAVAVSTPFQLDQCSKALLQGSSQIYGRYFFKQLADNFESKKQYLNSIHAVEELEKLNQLGPISALETLWDFDDKITAPLHGFRDADDYYQQCSAARYIEGITTSTLLIHSNNDPLIPESAIPLETSLPDSVTLELYSKGGHVGFISGTHENWLEQRIYQQILS